MKTYLGIDLGGTKLLIAEVDELGNIYRQKHYDTGYFNQESAFDIIRSSVDDYIQNVGFTSGTPEAMGIGLIGRVDSKNGIWQQIDPDRTHPLPIARQLSDLYGMPCFIDNDVKSATQAEMKWGFGRTTDDFIYLNVGTGIATGMIVGGRLIRGSHFNAGEVGHVRTGVRVGVTCPCGRVDCVEAIASGMGIDRCARLFHDQYPNTRLQIPTDNKRVRAQDVFKLYQEGDELCKFLVDNAAEALANLIMNLVRISDPDTVVLGGGLVADGFMLAQINKYLQPITMRFVTNGVVITKLNPQFIGVLGAAAIAMQ